MSDSIERLRYLLNPLNLIKDFIQSQKSLNQVKSEIDSKIERWATDIEQEAHVVHEFLINQSLDIRKREASSLIKLSEYALEKDVKWIKNQVKMDLAGQTALELLSAKNTMNVTHELVHKISDAWAFGRISEALSESKRILSYEEEARETGLTASQKVQLIHLIAQNFDSYSELSANLKAELCSLIVNGSKDNLRKRYPIHITEKQSDIDRKQVEAIWGKYFA